MIPSNKKIGIIGGGQLGKMTCEAALPMNLHVEILDAQNAPASIAATKTVVGDITSAQDIFNFGQHLDVISYEIESINIEGLKQLEAIGKEVIPHTQALATIKDKGLQKQYYTANNTPTINYCVPKSQLEFTTFINNTPGTQVVLKQRQGGYDGKGVEIVNKEQALAKAAQFDQYLIEEFLENIIEYSVIIAVSDTEIVAYPLVEMYFNEQSNLVDFLFSPAQVSDSLALQCTQIATKAVQGLQSKGLFAVELMVHNNQVYVNEMAPRPHNSGHHTIEGCYTSQFEQFSRILFNLPLGSTQLVCPCAMVNLVGGTGQTGNYTLQHYAQLLQIPGVYIHLYNKTQIKPNRKMGHINIIAPTFEQLIHKAKQVQSLATFQV